MENVKKMVSATREKPQRTNKKSRFNSIYLYLLPWFIGILIFRLYPFINAIYLSLQNNNLITDPEFIGLANYQELLFGSTQTGVLFRTSVMVTFRYVFLTVPLVLVFALFVAFILNFRLKGINFFRTAFYIPSILGGSVSVSIIWKFMFGNQGLVNAFLELFGIEAVGWLVDTRFAIIVLALLRAWQFGSVMLIFLSALQNVPVSLYEAASIDGATKIRQFFTVTVPIITPVILFNTIQVLVNAFQEFNAAYLVSDGGPLNSTLLLNLFIYRTAFNSFQMGISSAASWIMFSIIMVFTIILFKSSNHWVHYSD